MRFSTAFHLPLASRFTAAERPAPVREAIAPERQPQESATAESDLPDDLDQRVRLIGEWQLGED